MNRPFSAVLIALLLVAGVAAAVVSSSARRDASDADRVAAEAAFAARLEAQSGEHARAVAALEERIAQLERANVRLVAELAEERARNEELGARPASGSDDDSSGPAVALDDEPQDPAEALAPEFDLEASVDLVLDRSLDGSERQKHWKAIVEHGRIDDAVAAVEAYARARPHDADAQATLGDTYIQKLVKVNDLEKGIWTKKADVAYDQALAADDHHWGARFAKALSYSFHPPVFGLQPKAIEQFEILRAQQEERSPEPRFAETYLLLGNLYATRGDDEKARAAWSRGREFFPEDEDLRSKFADPAAAR